MAEMEVSDGDELVTLVRLKSRDEDEDDAEEVGDAPPSPPRDPPSPREVGTSAAAAPSARVAVLVPFREDGTGRAAQLSSLLARLATLFPDPDQCVVVVAEQSADGRKFNRGQLLNVAFAHLRASHPEWISRDTLYCFHDCDMLPAPSLAHHYLRPRPLHPESNPPPLGPFVRVLTAAGSRYDHDACFGGVTLYDASGFLATNGYPNGFWGWGGEDNAQFLRCARARLWLERVHRCAFDDLEGLDTVEEKLAALDVAGARCAAKDKRRLLSRNARGDAWTRDGLADVRFEIEGDEIQLGGGPSADANHGSSPSPSPSPRGVRFVARLLAARWDELRCVECGESKGPDGYATSQYRTAMFWAKKTGNEAGQGDERNPARCHWDERGEVEGEGEGEGELETGGDAVSSSSSSSARRRGARCLECVAKDPRTVAARRNAEVNQRDVSRVTCAACGVVHASRNELFAHLGSTACGQANEA